MSFLSPVNEARVVAAIIAAEARTSGEIRVYVSSRKTPEPVKAAEAHFVRMNMTQTAQRNGVLFFIAPASHTFAVIGDRGVHEKCGHTFWTELATTMGEKFKQGDFTHGLVLGIQRAGDLLAQHFPRDAGDQNELPDRIEGT